MTLRKYKYTILAVTIAIILFGIFAKSTLQIQLFPETAPPLINVITNYPGASAYEVATDVTRPLEEEFSTIDGVKSIKSTSQNDLSVIKVEFFYGIDVDTAVLDVQNAVDRSLEELPDGVRKPEVLKFSTADKPVIVLALKSNTLSMGDLRTYADNEIKNNLQTVEGVAAVDVFGGYRRQINVILDQDKMRIYKITPEEVIRSLRAENVVTSIGRIKNEAEEISLRLVNDFENIEEIKDMIVSYRNGSIVRLENVAEIADAHKEVRSEYRYKGHRVIALQVLKTDDANTLEVVKRVKARVNELETMFPAVQFETAQDASVFTEQVISNMTGSIGYALLLTAIVILMFLVSLTESVLVAFSMPLSFLSTLGLMKISGMQLDIVTMSALILSIGFVVDNSVVVVENIIRYHRETGKEISRAAFEGTKEVTLAILAGSGTTIIVLVPLLFVKGFAGKVFGPFSVTLIFSILSSLFVALVIIPLFVTMSQNKRWKWGEEKLQLILKPFAKGMDNLKKIYLTVLKRALHHKFITLGVSVFLLLLSLNTLASIGMEVLPKLDTGTFNITVRAYSGTGIDKMFRIVDRIEKILEEEKEVIDYTSQIGYEPGGHFLGDSGALGVNNAYFTVNLTSRKLRNETIWEIEERIRKKISLLPGVESYIVKEEGGTAVATTTAPIDIRISGPDKEVLAYLGNAVMEKVSRVPGAVNIYCGWKLSAPEYILEIDDKRARELGLMPRDIAGQVFKKNQGMVATDLEQEFREDVPVKVRFSNFDRENIVRFLDTTLYSPLGIEVPLREVVTVKKKFGPNIITREDLRYTLDIYGFTYDRAFSHVIGDIEKRLDEINLPSGYEVSITGEQSNLKEASSDLKFSFILALISVYLLLVAQFKSFTNPVAIIAAVPLILIGVAASLKFTGKFVSMPVMMGFILLAGTVVNNSILLVDYTNRKLREGEEPEEAILGSVRQRFRPIMMTALSDVGGMLPLALELALGSERFSPLATAVIGGILSATFLTMIIIPVVYLLLISASRSLNSRKFLNFLKPCD